MTSSAAVLRFSAEFATFLVAVAGASIVGLRPGLLGVRRQSQVVLVLGFLALAAAAFLHGSLLYEARDLPVLVVRGAGILLLAVGTLGWGDDPNTRRVVWVALVLMTMAEVAVTVGVTPGVADATRAAGALGLGAVLISSARRSIPARVAVSTAATILVVVMAVSIALSLVISDNVQNEAFRRVEVRARAEAQEVGSASLPAAVRSATLVANILQSRHPDVLQALSQKPGRSAVLESDLDALVASDLLRKETPVLYATDKRFIVVERNLDLAGAEVLVSSPAVDEALGAKRTSATVEVVGDRALAVGADAIFVATPEGTTPVGVFVATSPLDNAYLTGRTLNDPSVSLAVVDRSRRLAGAGTNLPAADVVRVGRAAMASRDGRARAVAGGAFLVARTVTAPDGTPVVAMVAATPTTVVDNTRSSLFRTLFVFALVTALGAFLAALFVGERIGGGLRRLTLAAEAVRRGDYTTRVGGVMGQDELGVLGSTLDTMAGSIETLTTELRQNRDEEARLRSRLEAVVGGMGEAVVAVDQSGRITTFNDAAAELFGVAADRAEGRPVSEVVRVGATDGTDLTPRLARPESGRWAAPAVVSRPDGVDIPVALSAGGLHEAGGGVGGGVWVLRDMRREREAERTKADLLANISHELRTPLVPIKGYAMILRRSTLPRKESEAALGAITDAADQLERVVGRLLEVASRGPDEADGGGDGDGGDGGPSGRPGRAGAERRPTEVRPLVDTVVRRWKAKEGHRHPITRRVARNLPELVADRRRIEESLDELIDNAVKFSPDGSRILVAARLHDNGDGGGPAVEISVDDLGTGISEDDLGRIFEDFTQADSSSTRSFGGLGLGLSVVRRTVEAHDGELVCETEEGKGSRFSMILPVMPMDEDGR